ncbi:MAG: hypothetical protein OXI95_20020 [bacterium]|nr:hypothetical protein [bacterium]MDE0419200.1 hypothetical protein [bacterium]
MSGWQLPIAAQAALSLRDAGQIGGLVRAGARAVRSIPTVVPNHFERRIAVTTPSTVSPFTSGSI